MLKPFKILVILSVLLFGINVAYASGNNEITVSSTTGLPNDIVTVYISISANTGCAAGSFNLQYDANKLLLNNCLKGSALTGVNTTINTAYTPNTLRVNWLSTNLINAGSLFTITFKIKSDAVGNADLLIQNVKLSDINANPVSFSLSNGVVAVEYIPTPIPTATATETPTLTPTAIPTLTPTATPTTTLLGDVNGDGKILPSDALKILQFISGKITLTDAQKVASDVTKNGILQPSDALKIIQFCSGKIIEL